MSVKSYGSYIGSYFNTLEVLGISKKHFKTEKCNYYQYYFNTLCKDCGNRYSYRASSLITGKVKDCYVCRSLKHYGLKLGDRIGRLKLISVSTTKRCKVILNCKCDCGNDYDSSPAILKSNHVLSCGCKRSENAKSCMDKNRGRFTVLRNAKSNPNKNSKSGYKNIQIKEKKGHLTYLVKVIRGGERKFATVYSLSDALSKRAEFLSYFKRKGL